MSLTIIILVLFASATAFEADSPSAEECPYGYFFDQGHCQECLSTCPFCTHIGFYDEICARCGDGFKFNHKGTACEACEEGELFCDWKDGYYGEYPYRRSYWIEKEQVWIMEGDVVKPCNYCFKAGDRCEEQKQFGKKQEKCGAKQYSKDYNPSNGDHYMNSTFEGLSLQHQTIKDSDYEWNICVFNVMAVQVEILSSNFTDKVSFYSTKFHSTHLKHSKFANRVYFRNVDFLDTFINGTVFENMVSFYSSSFPRAEIKSSNFMGNVTFINTLFTGTFIKSTNFRMVAFKNCSFEDVHWEGVSFNEVVFEGCRLSNNSWVDVEMVKTNFTNCSLTSIDNRRSKLSFCGFQNSNLVDVGLERGTVTNSTFEGCYAPEVNLQAEWKGNSSRWIEQQYEISAEDKVLPFDEEYSSYECGKCDKRCSLCMEKPSFCLECARGYEREGWKCIKQTHLTFQLFINAHRRELKAAFSNIKSDILRTVGYKQRESLTIRELYEEGSVIQVTGTLEQEEINIEKVRKRLAVVRELGRLQVLEVKFGEPEPHPEGGRLWLVGLAVVGIILVGWLVCWKLRCCQKLKGRRKMEYEIYGSFNEESIK